MSPCSLAKLQTCCRWHGPIITLPLYLTLLRDGTHILRLLVYFQASLAVTSLLRLLQFQIVWVLVHVLHCHRRILVLEEPDTLLFLDAFSLRRDGCLVPEHIHLATGTQLLPARHFCLAVCGTYHIRDQVPHLTTQRSQLYQ